MSEPNSESPVVLPPVWVALLPIAVLLVSMGLTIIVFGKDPHIPLILTAIAAALVSRWHGVSWTALERGMLRGIGVGTKAIIILLVIGVLIAGWIIAGVVPYLISLGLELLNPRAFLPTACVICAVVSLATGSSWTTASTVGVSLMGVGNWLALQPAMVAEAIVSGAYFGDKMSPLSDSTNLAPAVPGVEIFDHIRHMLYTTAPPLEIYLVLYS
ncbi:MAG: hypothetical protein MKZ70_06300, partial [Opitutales bacterium]|nr:hypothetical protein [Opitutales bacterium]